MNDAEIEKFDEVIVATANWARGRPAAYPADEVFTRLRALQK
jgi:hypothetical protein